MIERSHFPFKYKMLLYPLFMVLFIWVIYWFEIHFNTDFAPWGIRPRNILGLRGIFFSPFIHGDGFHLLHNSLPLLILGTSLFYFYEAISWKVILWGGLITGILTWIIGRDSYHIGASGIIYLLFGFLSLKGLVSNHFRLLALSFFVVFMYGSMVWYVTPIKDGISWEGHLSGMLTGFVFALIFHKKIAVKPKYAWEDSKYDEEDEFMKCFDENGNFISTSERLQKEKDAKEDENRNTTLISPIRLIYHHTPSKKKLLNKKRNL